MCYSKWSGYLDVPMNRLATQTVCYFLFLVWILLTMINPSDDPDKVDWNVYDILAFVWTLGYIISDVQMMHQLTESLRMHSASSKYKVGGNTFPAEKKAVKAAFLISVSAVVQGEDWQVLLQRLLRLPLPQPRPLLQRAGRRVPWLQGGRRVRGAKKMLARIWFKEKHWS